MGKSVGRFSNALIHSLSFPVSEAAGDLATNNV